MSLRKNDEMVDDDIANTNIAELFGEEEELPLTQEETRKINDDHEHEMSIDVGNQYLEEEDDIDSFESTSDEDDSDLNSNYGVYDGIDNQSSCLLNQKRLDTEKMDTCDNIARRMMYSRFQEIPTDYIESICCINFTYQHFEKGAGLWSELKEPYRSLLAQFLNNLAYVVGTKSIRQVLDGFPKLTNRGGAAAAAAAQNKARDAFDAVNTPTSNLNNNNNKGTKRKTKSSNDTMDNDDMTDSWYGNLIFSPRLRIYIETLFGNVVKNRVMGFRWWFITFNRTDVQLIGRFEKPFHSINTNNNRLQGGGGGHSMSRHHPSVLSLYDSGLNDNIDSDEYSVSSSVYGYSNTGTGGGGSTTGGANNQRFDSDERNFERIDLIRGFQSSYKEAAKLAEIHKNQALLYYNMKKGGKTRPPLKDKSILDHYSFVFQPTYSQSFYALFKKYFKADDANRLVYNERDEVRRALGQPTPALSSLTNDPTLGAVSTSTTSESTTTPTSKRTFGKFIDNRRFLTTVDQLNSQLTNISVHDENSFMHHANPFNFINMFSVEASMMYHVRSGNINDKQCLLGTYFSLPESSASSSSTKSNAFSNNEHPFLYNFLKKSDITDYRVDYTSFRSFFNEDTTYLLGNDFCSPELLIQAPLPHRIGATLPVKTEQIIDVDSDNLVELFKDLTIYEQRSKISSSVAVDGQSNINDDDGESNLQMDEDDEDAMRSRSNSKMQIEKCVTTLMDKNNPNVVGINGGISTSHPASSNILKLMGIHDVEYKPEMEELSKFAAKEIMQSMSTSLESGHLNEEMDRISLEFISACKDIVHQKMTRKKQLLMVQPSHEFYLLKYAQVLVKNTYGITINKSSFGDLMNINSNATTSSLSDALDIDFNQQDSIYIPSTGAKLIQNMYPLQSTVKKTRKPRESKKNKKSTSTEGVKGKSKKTLLIMDDGTVLPVDGMNSEYNGEEDYVVSDNEQDEEYDEEIESSSSTTHGIIDDGYNRDENEAFTVGKKEGVLWNSAAQIPYIKTNLNDQKWKVNLATANYSLVQPHLTKFGCAEALAETSTTKFGKCDLEPKFLERDDILRLGVCNRYRWKVFNAMYYDQKTGKIPAHKEEAYRVDKPYLIGAMGVELFHVFNSSKKLTQSGFGIRKDFLTFTKQLPNSIQCVDLDMPIMPYKIDVRPYHQFRIWVNVFFNKICDVYYNYGIMNVLYFSRFHHCRYYYDHSNPKNNVFIHGFGQTGKSYMFKLIAKLCPSDVCKSISKMTANWMNVNHNLDEILLIMEEVQNSFLASSDKFGPNANNNGNADDRVNYLKNMLTSGKTNTMSITIADDGSRVTTEHVASLQITILGASNSHLNALDKDVLARLLVISVPLLTKDAGGIKTNDNGLWAYEQNENGEIIFEQHRQVHRVYYMTEQLIKAAVFEDPIMGIQYEQALIAINAILDDLEVEHGIKTSGQRKRNAVLELARSMCIAGASFNALTSILLRHLQYHPAQTDIHGKPIYIGFNLRVLVEGVLPFLVITKDHVIDALLSLRNIWEHDYLDKILNPITVKFCNLNRIRERDFRRVYAENENADDGNGDDDQMPASTSTNALVNAKNAAAHKGKTAAASGYGNKRAKKNDEFSNDAIRRGEASEMDSKGGGGKSSNFDSSGKKFSFLNGKMINDATGGLQKALDKSASHVATSVHDVKIGKDTTRGGGGNGDEDEQVESSSSRILSLNYERDVAEKHEVRVVNHYADAEEKARDVLRKAGKLNHLRRNQSNPSISSTESLYPDGIGSTQFPKSKLVIHDNIGPYYIDYNYVTLTAKEFKTIRVKLSKEFGNFQIEWSDISKIIFDLQDEYSDDLPGYILEVVQINREDYDPEKHILVDSRNQKDSVNKNLINEDPEIEEGKRIIDMGIGLFSDQSTNEQEENDNNGEQDKDEEEVLLDENVYVENNNEEVAQNEQEGVEDDAIKQEVVPNSDVHNLLQSTTFLQSTNASVSVALDAVAAASSVNTTFDATVESDNEDEEEEDNHCEVEEKVISQQQEMEIEEEREEEEQHDDQTIHQPTRRLPKDKVLIKRLVRNPDPSSIMKRSKVLKEYVNGSFRLSILVSYLKQKLPHILTDDIIEDLDPDSPISRRNRQTVEKMNANSLNKKREEEEEEMNKQNGVDKGDIPYEDIVSRCSVDLTNTSTSVALIHAIKKFYENCVLETVENVDADVENTCFFQPFMRSCVATEAVCTIPWFDYVTPVSPPPLSIDKFKPELMAQYRKHRSGCATEIPFLDILCSLTLERRMDVKPTQYINTQVVSPSAALCLSIYDPNEQQMNPDLLVKNTVRRVTTTPCFVIDQDLDYLACRAHLDKICYQPISKNSELFKTISYPPFHYMLQVRYYTKHMEERATFPVNIGGNPYEGRLVYPFWDIAARISDRVSTMRKALNPESSSTSEKMSSLIYSNYEDTEGKKLDLNIGKLQRSERNRHVSSKLPKSTSRETKRAIIREEQERERQRNEYQRQSSIDLLRGMDIGREIRPKNLSQQQQSSMNENNHHSNAILAAASLVRRDYKKKGHRSSDISTKSTSNKSSNQLNKRIVLNKSTFQPGRAGAVAAAVDTASSKSIVVDTSQAVPVPIPTIIPAMPLSLSGNQQPIIPLKQPSTSQIKPQTSKQPPPSLVQLPPSPNQGLPQNLRKPNDQRGVTLTVQEMLGLTTSKDT